MNKEDFKKLVDIIENVSHDFEFHFRDLEQTFDDGFNNCRQRILSAISKKYRPAPNTNLKDKE